MRKAGKAGALLLLWMTAGICMTGCEQKQVSLIDSSQAPASVAPSEGIITMQQFGEEVRNFTLPEIGEEVVILTIENYGDVKIRLFDDETAKGAENFRELARSGYYDELIFHRVIDSFMIQGGDPKGNGTGGKDYWGSSDGFTQTISPRLRHVTGAVAYAIGQDKLNKSQFYIVTGCDTPLDFLNMVNQSYGIAFSEAVQVAYEAFGGAPHLDTGYEIFGQVYDGMEHVLAIQKVETDGNNKPKQAVRIEKATVVPYEGEAPTWLTWNGSEVRFSE